MSKDTNILAEVGIFLAGVVAAGLLTSRRGEQAPPAEPRPVRVPENWQRTLTDLEKRLAAQEANTASRFIEVEKRLEEQSARLTDIPSTQQIVSAMEQLIAKTMSSLDDRFTNQAHSIEVLKTTVSQTDSLLERVLESLDSLQSYTEPMELTDDPVLQRPA